MSWEIWISDPWGRRNKLLDSVGEFELVRSVNKVGAFELNINQTVDYRLFMTDSLVEFWRSPSVGGLRLIMVGIVREWEFSELKNAYTVRGPDQLDLLARRIVAYGTGTSQADKTDYADDMLKAVIYDNFGAGALTARQMSCINITNDLSQAPSVVQSMAWKNVMIVLQEICAASATAGTNLYFDLVPVSQADGTLKFDFTTYITQRGSNRSWNSGSPVVFGEKYGNLEKPNVVYDRRDERNYIYAGGTDAGSERDVQISEDASTIGDSPWNRCEEFVNASQDETETGTENSADIALEDGKMTHDYSGNLLSVRGCEYGLDWEFGDRVTMEHWIGSYDGAIRAIRIKVNGDGEESIEAKMEMDV